MTGNGALPLTWKRPRHSAAASAWPAIGQPGLPGAAGSRTGPPTPSPEARPQGPQEAWLSKDVPGMTALWALGEVQPPRRFLSGLRKPFRARCRRASEEERSALREVQTSRCRRVIAADAWMNRAKNGHRAHALSERRTRARSHSRLSRKALTRCITGPYWYSYRPLESKAICAVSFPVSLVPPAEVSEQRM